METKMLRCICGVLRYGHVRNNDIRNLYGIVSIVEKLWEAFSVIWLCHLTKLMNLDQTYDREK